MWTFEKEGRSALHEALFDSDIHVRQMAAVLLGKSGDGRDVEYLVAKLGDSDKRVRKCAMLALVEIGDPALERISNALKAPDWIIRYRAAEALGLMGNADAVNTLIEALGDEKDHVRYMAAKGLYMLAEIRSISPLIGILDDENLHVRSMAVRALGRIGGVQACEALHLALTRERSAAVMREISRTLKKSCP